MIRLAAALALLIAALPAAAQRLAADVDCKPTKHDLVYDCRIALKEAKSGKPVSGAEVSVGADMPSMPMAHNVKPVKAKPGAAPGEYERADRARDVRRVGAEAQRPRAGARRDREEARLPRTAALGANPVEAQSTGTFRPLSTSTCDTAGALFPHVCRM